MKKLMPWIAGGALLTMVIICIYAVVTMPPKVGSYADPAVKEVVMLDGVWKSEKSNDVYFEALVKGNSIEVNLITKDPTEGGELTGLYWAGTFQSQDDKTWTSVADKERLDSSMLGSSELTKPFTYDGKSLSFKFGALGVTKTIKMEKN